MVQAEEVAVKAESLLLKKRQRRRNPFGRTVSMLKKGRCVLILLALIITVIIVIRLSL